MKSYKFFVFLVLMLGAVTASAQWAGKDQEVFRNNDNSQTVTLSVTSANPKACYKWTGPNIQGDPNQPSVTAKPQQAQQTYVCQRISAEGVEEDEVIVKVFDSVQIVSVTPKKRCYSAGDGVVTSDFNIVTEPKGYENQVTASPSSVGGIFTGVQNNDGSYNVELTFSLTVNNHTSTKKTNVVVIDPDMGLSPSVGIDIYSFVQTCRKINELETEMTTLANKMKEATEAGNSALKQCVELKPPHFYFGEFQVGEWRWMCCNDTRTQLVPISWGGMSAECGIAITVPFPIAAIPGLAFYLTAESKTNVGLTGCTFNMSHMKECSNVELTLGITSTVSGAAGICFMSPSILSAQLGIEGQGSSSIIWKVTEGKVVWRPLLLTGSVTGQILVAGGIFKQSAKWTFLKIQIGG